MKSRWNDLEAQKLIATYEKDEYEADMALRVYTTHLLGQNPSLVLYGGGNTSYKTRATDFVGEVHDVLCVKGSGWDMGSIEPAGLPAVKLAPLLQTRKLDWLSDEDMVAAQRLNLLDVNSPNPSVEALLHAFLPHKFVDHTHSNAQFPRSLGWLEENGLLGEIPRASTVLFSLRMRGTNTHEDFEGSSTLPERFPMQVMHLLWLTRPFQWDHGMGAEILDRLTATLPSITLKSLLRTAWWIAKSSY